MVSSISPVMLSDPARIHNWLSLMPSLRWRHRYALCYNKTKETGDTQPIFWTNMLFTKKSLLTWFVPVNFPNQTVISQPKPWWPNCYFPPQTLMLTCKYFTCWEKKKHCLICNFIKSSRYQLGNNESHDPLKNSSQEICTWNISSLLPVYLSQNQINE